MKKTCRQCSIELDIESFYRKDNCRSGRQSICKACHRTNMRANRAANPERPREYDRKRNSLPHRVNSRKEWRRTAAGKWCKANEKVRQPIKYAARGAVRKAVRSGRLIRQPCEICGEYAHAHHDDYSKPLDVRWLCPKHHAEWHKHNTPLCPDQEQAA